MGARSALRSLLRIPELNASTLVGFNRAGRVAFDEGDIGGSELRQDIATSLSHGEKSIGELAHDVNVFVPDVIKELKKMLGARYIRFQNIE